MKKVFLISHGEFADGLKMSAEMICGKQKNLISKCLMVGEHPTKYIEEIESELVQDEENIIIADLLGGSMCNEAMKLLKYDNVFLLSGMNLPLVVEILFAETISNEELERIVNGVRELQKVVKIEKFVIRDEDFF